MEYAYIITVDISLSENKSKKCGLCIYDNTINYDSSYWKNVKLESIAFCELLQKITNDFFDVSKTFFVFEDSNLTKGNWHGSTARGGVGKNKATCIIFRQWLDLHDCHYIAIPPVGYSQFFKDKDFFKKITGFEKVPNADVRASAAMLYLNFYNVK